MKFKSTWILFLIVLLLASYAYFGEYKKDQEDQAKKEIETTLIKDKIDQINSLVLKTAKEKIEIIRSPDGWKLESPVKDWAESDTVDAFLNGLVTEKSLEVAKEGEGINWIDFGLEKPEAQMILKSQAGNETTIDISSKKNFEGNSILRLNGKNQVLVASSTWNTRATKTGFEFRQKNFLRTKASSIDKLKVKSNEGQIQIESKDGKWVLLGAPMRLLDQNKVREILASLNDSKAQEILVDSQPTSADLKKFSLDKPHIEIEIDLKGKIWKGQIAQNKEKMIYAVISEPPMLMKLDVGTFEKFQKISPFLLSDHSSPFQWPKGDIKSIEFSGTLKKSRFEFDGALWKVVGDEKASTISPDQVKDFFEKIKKIQVQSFEPMAKNFKSENFIALKDTEGKEVFRLEWAAAKKFKIAGIERTLHLGKTNLSDELFTMEESSVSGLKLEPPPPPPPSPETSSTAPPEAAAKDTAKKDTVKKEETR